MQNSTITLAEASTKIIIESEKKSEHYKALMDKITHETELLEGDIPNSKKLDIIVSIEYLLVKLRLDIEFEHLNVKEILASRNCEQSLRTIFVKRDTLLSSYIVKLNNIRDDISALQKLVYTKTNFNFSK